MDAETITRLVNLATILVLAVVAGGNLALAARWRRRAQVEHQAHLETMDAMDLMTRAQDPGREVHQRLAAAMEAGIIRTGGPTIPEPAARRAAAMAMSAALLENVRRAGLRITLDDDTPVDMDDTRAAALEALEGQTA